MRKWAVVVISIFVLAVLVSCSNQDRGKYDDMWLRNYNEALAKSKAENKPMMVDFYTDLCHWCTVLDEETFSQKRVMDEISTHFVLLKIDAGRNELLRRKYGVNSFPRIMFISSDEKILYQIRGFLQPDDFLKEVDRAKEKSGIIS